MVQADLMVKLLIGVVLIAIGYAWGYLPEHNAFTTYRAQVEQAGKDQAAQSKATAELNRKLAEEKRNEYQTNLNRNTALWTKRLQNYSKCTVSPNPTAASGIAETFADTLPVDKLIMDCQATTVQCVSLQDWAKGIR